MARSQVPADVRFALHDNLFAYAPMGERLRLTATAEFSGYDRGHRPADFAAMLKTAKIRISRRLSKNNQRFWIRTL